MIQLIERAKKRASQEALISNHISYTYHQLLERSAQIASELLDGKPDLNEARVAFIVDPSF